MKSSQLLYKTKNLKKNQLAMETKGTAQNLSFNLHILKQIISKTNITHNFFKKIINQRKPRIFLTDTFKRSSAHQL